VAGHAGMTPRRSWWATAWAGWSPSSPPPATAIDWPGGDRRLARPPPCPESERMQYATAFRNPKTYPDQQTALAHFRLIPEQPCEKLLHPRARGPPPVRQAADGSWTWKFDRQIFRHRVPPLSEQLASVRVRVALFRGDQSTVVPEEDQPVHVRVARAERPGGRDPGRPPPPHPGPAPGLHRRPADPARGLGTSTPTDRHHP